MTRKRFVKLLMAEGYSRNSANVVAEDVREDGFSYAEGYDYVTNLLPYVQEFVGSLDDAIETVMTSLAKFVTAAVEAVRAAAEAFHAAMSQT